TRTGASVGTRAYMSPEQVRKQPLDARSDLFSLGLVLYEMATGQRAFTDETSTATDKTDTSADESEIGALSPHPRRLKPAISRSLNAVIGRALETEPSRRYQTAGEMRGDLERIRDRRLSPERRRIRYALAGAVLLALLVSGAWMWRWRAP